MENKDITINELAVMVKNGFDGADKRVSDRFDGVDKKFDGVYERFDRLDERLDKLEYNQRTILTKLEDVVYRSELTQLKERIKIIEEAIAIKGN